MAFFTKFLDERVKQSLIWKIFDSSPPSRWKILGNFYAHEQIFFKTHQYKKNVRIPLPPPSSKKCFSWSTSILTLKIIIKIPRMNVNGPHLFSIFFTFTSVSLFAPNSCVKWINNTKLDTLLEQSLQKNKKYSSWKTVGKLY